MSIWRSLQLSFDDIDAMEEESNFEEEMLRSALLRHSGATRVSRATPTPFPPAASSSWPAVHKHKALFQPSTIHHWQLRHLVRPLRTEEGEELLVMVHQREIFAVQPDKPTEGRRCAKVSIVTAEFDPICLDAGHGFLALGGSEGQLHMFVLDAACTTASELLKSNDVCNSAVNSLEICTLADQSVALVITSNDHEVAVMSLPTLEVRYSKLFETPLNYATVSPSGKQMVVVGDCFTTYLMGLGAELEHLGGFRNAKDFSFCAGWHSNSRTFASGSQDGVVSVWDARMSSSSSAFSTKGNTIAEFRSAQASSAGAIRSLAFSQCPLRRLDLLVFAEQSNRFSIVDTRSFYDRQEVDISQFALPRGLDYNIDIAGTAFSTDWSRLYVAVKSKLHVWDVNVQLRRTHAAFDIR